MDYWDEIDAWHKDEYGYPFSEVWQKSGGSVCWKRINEFINFKIKAKP